jgi:hypothetical protein
MATHIGRDGVIKVGGVVVAEVRSFSVEETGDTVENTTMTATNRTFLATLNSFTATADVYWDETDSTGQGALTVGSSVTMGFYPEGDAVGDVYYEGDCIVTGFSRSASFDGMVEASITLQGSDATGLAEQTQT